MIKIFFHGSNPTQNQREKRIYPPPKQQKGTKFEPRERNGTLRKKREQALVDKLLDFGDQNALNVKIYKRSKEESGFKE